MDAVPRQLGSYQVSGAPMIGMPLWRSMEYQFFLGPGGLSKSSEYVAAMFNNLHMLQKKIRVRKGPKALLRMNCLHDICFIHLMNVHEECAIRKKSPWIVRVFMMRPRNFCKYAA